MLVEYKRYGRNTGKSRGAGCECMKSSEAKLHSELVSVAAVLNSGNFVAWDTFNRCSGGRGGGGTSAWHKRSVSMSESRVAGARPRTLR